MFKRLWGLHNMYIILICFAAAQTLAFYFVNKPLFYISLVLFLVLTVFAVIKLATMGSRINKLIKSINEDLDSTTSNALSVFSLPVIIVSEQDEVLWYNSKFSKEINPEAETLVGKTLTELVGTAAAERLSKKFYATCTFGNRILDAYQTVYNIGGEDQKIICFVDLTELRKTAAEYKLSRPVVAFVVIDNLDDITRNLRDSERNTVISKIQTVLEEWFSTVNGISRRLSGDKYLFIFEDRDLISFEANRFDILTKIREIDFGDKGCATISIGIGTGGSFKDCEDKAAQALDMALGRGGDQVAVKYKDNTFKFFGGVSGGSRTNTRVRARMAAATIFNIIKNSNSVVVMGHKFADLDCYGAAYAICSAIRKATGISSVIALDTETAMVDELILRLKKLGQDTMIYKPEDVLLDTTKNTTVIVVDTHREGLLENSQILKNAGNVVIIDHHRKAVDFIDNCAFFYHDPAASSASEMVCELLQYVGSDILGKAEAEALLAGVFLDTKGFSINTGIRTFEASAYLRKMGADPTAVKRMFSDSIDTYKLKNSVVSTAEKYKNFIFAYNDTNLPLEEKKVVSSKVADELLSIQGIKATFVFTKHLDSIFISARSLGDCNVQIIMEMLGGGGHRNAAGAGLETNDFEAAKSSLIEAIDNTEKG